MLITTCNAQEYNNQTTDNNQDYHQNLGISKDDPLSDKNSDNLINQINNAKDNEEILINPGTYKIHNILIKKNITLQGNGNARDIIFDGEKLSSILLVRNSNVHLRINNITFINGLTYNFGGAISTETGNVYVDNCIFKDNTALGRTNAGAISNYGNATERAYLLVNNSLFINNHADHDGGAITTCYASSDIYNSVFINNSAERDGGAIRVSIYGYGNVADCIFMYNHADEWGGAYYSWASNSKLDRCIFMNNTAGTNGGAIMVSGNFTMTNSIVVNNTSNETGGSFYIQQPMFNAITVIDIHDNLITNNYSPKGKEIYISWKNTELLFTKFNNNDWGDENPNDSSVIDPDHVTERSKVTSTIKSNLLNQLSLNLLTKYSDLINHYFPEDYLENINKNPQSNDEDSSNKPSDTISNTLTSDKKVNEEKNDENNDITTNSINEDYKTENIEKSVVSGNSTTGENKAYELNQSNSVAKQSNLDIRIFIFGILVVFALLVIGYKSNKRKE